MKIKEYLIMLIYKKIKSMRDSINWGKTKTYHEREDINYCGKTKIYHGRDSTVDSRGITTRVTTREATPSAMS